MIPSMNRKKLTIDAGANSLNEIKYLALLKGDLVLFLFDLRKMPECKLKWEMSKVFKPQIKRMLKEIVQLEEYYIKEEK